MYIYIIYTHYSFIKYFYIKNYNNKDPPLKMKIVKYQNCYIN